MTLEATHHGPYVNLPTCFAEIGSSENEWYVMLLCAGLMSAWFCVCVVVCVPNKLATLC